MCFQKWSESSASIGNVVTDVAHRVSPHFLHCCKVQTLFTLSFSKIGTAPLDGTGYECKPKTAEKNQESWPGLISTHLQSSHYSSTAPWGWTPLSLCSFRADVATQHHSNMFTHHMCGWDEGRTVKTLKTSSLALSFYWADWSEYAEGGGLGLFGCMCGGRVPHKDRRNTTQRSLIRVRS